MQVEGETLIPPKPLPWYPNNLAWQLTYSRAQLRKLDALNQIHEMLKEENTSGGITRQEAVSMAPPLFLDIQPHHKVPPPPVLFIHRLSEFLSLYTSIGPADTTSVLPHITFFSGHV